MKRTYEICIDFDEKKCWQKSIKRLQRLAIYTFLMEKPMRWVDLKETLKMHTVTISDLLTDMVYDGLIQKQYNKEENVTKYVLVDNSKRLY